MSTNLSNNVLNIAGLKEQMEIAVFEYIDTSSNWAKANERLTELLEQLVDYYVQYKRNKDVALPPVNTYWVLFLDIAAHLLYFTSLCKEHLINLDENPSEREIILNTYMIASASLPNATTDENQELLNEIEKNYKSSGGQKEISKGVRTIDSCIEAFDAYVQKL